MYEDLRNNPDVQLYASMPDGIYEIYKKTNPAMAWIVDRCRQIVEDQK